MLILVDNIKNNKTSLKKMLEVQLVHAPNQSCHHLIFMVLNILCVQSKVRHIGIYFLSLTASKVAEIKLFVL